MGMKGNAARILAIVIVPVFVGCTPAHQQPRSIAASRYSGLPDGVSQSPAPYRLPGAGDPVGRWRDGVLELTVFGSGTCPPTPIQLAAVPPDAVEVHFSDDYRNGCSADIAATTWVFNLPPSVDRAEALTVRLRGGGVPETDLRLDRATPAAPATR
jgi:hypothetical protein